MKLELKYLAGYLPYNLKVLSGFGEYSEIDSLYFSKDEHKRPSLNLMVSHFPKGFRGENFVDIKPILRPISDLTKEIEVDGEKFVPIKYLQEKVFMCELPDFKISNTLGIETNCEEKFYISFYDLNLMFEKLFEWHFDIYGLIENNLAIDINTLNL